MNGEILIVEPISETNAMDGLVQGGYYGSAAKRSHGNKAKSICR
jgi:hypothetical protein